MPKQEDWKAAFDEARAQALNVDAYTFQIAWAYAIAAPTPSASSVPVAIKVFGTGAQVVIEGTFDGEHAVVICPAKQPGEVGASAKREGPVTDDSLVDAVVLTFPTAEQVERVANALVAAPPANPAPSVLTDALTRIKSLVCGDRHPRWNNDHQVSISRGMIADIVDAALLQANGATK